MADGTLNKKAIFSDGTADFVRHVNRVCMRPLRFGAALGKMRQNM